MKFTSVVVVLASAVAVFAAPAVVDNFVTVKGDLQGLITAVSSLDRVFNSITTKPSDAQIASIAGVGIAITHDMSVAAADTKAAGALSDAESQEISQLAITLGARMEQTLADLIKLKPIIAETPGTSQRIELGLRLILNSGTPLVQALEGAVSLKFKLTIVQAANTIQAALQRALSAFN